MGSYVSVREALGGYRVVLALATLAWILAPSHAKAQEAGVGEETAPEGAESLSQALGEANEVRAAAAFDEAELAWSERRLADAAHLLEESLRLDPVAPTAFNLARVLAEMGRPTDSARHFDALLDGEYGRLAAPQVADVRERLARTTAAFGRIVIRGEGPGTARVRVDGETAGELSEGEVVRADVDPGTHRVIARLMHTDLEETVVVQRGEERNILFDLPAAPEPEGASRGVLRSPVFWTIIGVVAVGAVVSAVLLTRRDPDQVTDPVFGSLEALRGE